MKKNQMIIRAIDNNAIALFYKEEFIGYVGFNMFHFNTEKLKFYDLNEWILIHFYQKDVQNNKFKRNNSYVTDIEELRP